MPAAFTPFQVFASAAEAQPLLAALAAQGIATETAVEVDQLALDPSVANPQLFTTFVVKLHPADFEQAQQLQEHLNELRLRELPPDHYLYSFGNAELYDLLVRPDEWSSLDVTLARLLLQQRGQVVSAATLQQLRQQRATELAQPEPSHRGWLLAGYGLALLGGLFGLLVGAQLYFHRRELPDGRHTYAYSAADRAHGLRILVLGAVVFGLGLYFRLAP